MADETLVGGLRRDLNFKSLNIDAFLLFSLQLLQNKVPGKQSSSASWNSSFFLKSRQMDPFKSFCYGAGASETGGILISLLTKPPVLRSSNGPHLLLVMRVS